MPSNRSPYDSGSAPRGQKRLWLVLATLAASALVAGIAVLGLIDVAPKPQSVEKVISNDRLPR